MMDIPKVEAIYFADKETRSLMTYHTVQLMRNWLIPARYTQDVLDIMDVIGDLLKKYKLEKLFNDADTVYAKKPFMWEFLKYAVWNWDEYEFLREYVPCLYTLNMEYIGRLIEEVPGIGYLPTEPGDQHMAELFFLCMLKWRDLEPIDLDEYVALEEKLGSFVEPDEFHYIVNSCDDVMRDADVEELKHLDEMWLEFQWNEFNEFVDDLSEATKELKKRA